MKLTNYHTHTWRCFHAAQVCDKEYVENAIKAGFSVLSLKEEYADRIEIRIGLECEYFPQYMDWLRGIKSQADSLRERIRETPPSISDR